VASIRRIVVPLAIMIDIGFKETFDSVLTDAATIENQSSIIHGVFKSFGFKSIKTSTIENSESIEQALGQELKKNCIEFFDPSGHRLMLRPDHTTTIARLVSTRLNHLKLPLKLCYTDPVFRRSSKPWVHNAEIYQAGCEIIGDKSAEADALLIACCIETLQALGFKEFGIDVGHVDFTKGLSDNKREALLKGDYISFGSIPERAARVANMPDHLNQVLELLDKKGYAPLLSVNKGLVSGIYYYTGMIFEVYIKGCAEIVASGGRYDALCKLFGYDQPAVGFAINMNVLRKQS